MVVIGIGNIVRSDDGLGVRTLERLRERRDYRAEVRLIDGGTAGIMLLPHIADARHAIIIDAINIGAAPGTLARLADAKGVFATGMTPHDAGLADLLDAARLTGGWPEALILHGVQAGSTAIGTELSAPVAAAVDPLLDAVSADLTAWGYGAVADADRG